MITPAQELLNLAAYGLACGRVLVSELDYNLEGWAVGEAEDWLLQIANGSMVLDLHVEDGHARPVLRAAR